MIEKVLCKVLKGLSYYGKGTLLMYFLMETTLCKNGSLQRNFHVEQKALCKGISIWKRLFAKGFS